MLGVQFGRNAVLKRQHDKINVLGYFSAPDPARNPRFSGSPNTSYEKIDNELVDAMRGLQIYHKVGAHMDNTDFRHVVNWARVEWL
jgi:hypothetical protein